MLSHPRPAHHPLLHPLRHSQQVGSNLQPAQLQQIVDKTVIDADTDYDGLISFDDFTAIVAPGTSRG